ncbi:MAG: HNH endonuclease [bacterium]|nr:HNH endonuclease [bacterium]
MVQKWRWDQGRLEYFSFNNVRTIAQVLSELDGVTLTASYDPLRVELTERTGLTFPPTNRPDYKVWRNFARVFKCLFLATKIGNQLRVTDVCRRVAKLDGTGWSVDDYLSFIIKKFYFPSPIFERYSIDAKQTFPFCAILKYLISSYVNSGFGLIDIEQVFDLVIGNECTGTEDLDFYHSLSSSSYRPQNDELRQVREMLAFIGQASFLKWQGNVLYLDIEPNDAALLDQLRIIAQPTILPRHLDEDAEILSLGTVEDGEVIVATSVRELPSDLTFTEGKRSRINHLRIERSPNLRRLFFASLPNSVLCNMCGSNMKERYPWTENLLEIHHLLPLASTLNLKSKTVETSFDDLVPLCPNCHRSVHLYYGLWLQDHNLDDFLTAEDARIAYSQAKNLVRLE